MYQEGSVTIVIVVHLVLSTFLLKLFAFCRTLYLSLKTTGISCALNALNQGYGKRIWNWNWYVAVYFMHVWVWFVRCSPYCITSWTLSQLNLAMLNRTSQYVLLDGTLHVAVTHTIPVHFKQIEMGDIPVSRFNQDNWGGKLSYREHSLYCDISFRWYIVKKQK